MLAATAEDRATQLFYETPHRILDSLRDVAAVFGAGQPIVLARELTKLHEEFLRGTVAEVLGSLQARPVVRGEMVLLLPGTLVAGNAQAGQPAAQSLADEVRALMRDAGLAEMEALKRVAKARGLGKSEAYREWQRGKEKPGK